MLDALSACTSKEKKLPATYTIPKAKDRLGFVVADTVGDDTEGLGNFTTRGSAL